MEGEARSEWEFAQIESSSDYFDSSIIFNIVKDILGFVLYMHQQIPSILQDLSLEFDTLRDEYKELESLLTQSEMKASSRRQLNGRRREVKHGIRRLEKLMNTVSSLKTALQLMFSEIPNIEGVILVVGSSPLRPQHVYEMSFSHKMVVPESASDFTKSKSAEAMSRKAIRALISKGVGSASCQGPTKLFLFVKAPSSFILPLHFLPKRDFRYSKKIVAFRLQFKCRAQDQEMAVLHHDTQTGIPATLEDSTSNDLIWFQCRHIIKGLASGAPPPEE